MTSEQRGRLVKLWFQKNHEAREAAHATVRKVMKGVWVGRIGGEARGHVVTCATERNVRQLIDGHYNQAIMERLLKLHRGGNDEARQ